MKLERGSLVLGLVVVWERESFYWGNYLFF